MKKVLLLAISVVIVVMSFSFTILADEMTPKSVADVITEIRQEQGGGCTGPIDVDKVSDAKLEELGMMGSYQVDTLSTSDQNISTEDTTDWAGIVFGTLFFISFTFNIILGIKVMQKSRADLQ